MPWPYFIGRLAEAFNCRPSEALEEWLDAPCGFLEELLESRAYADAKRAVDEADRSGGKLGRPDGEMADLVAQVEIALHQAAQKKGGEGG